MLSYAKLFTALLGVSIAWVFGNPCNAQPKINRIDPPAISFGKSTTIRIYGTNLNQVKNWIATCSIDVQLDGSAKNTATVQQLTVTPKDEQAAGINLIRGIGNRVATNFFPIAIDRIPSRTIQPDKAIKVEKVLPAVSYFGLLSGQQKAILDFKAAKNQSIKIEIESVRLGSKLRPTLFLLDEKDRQLQWAQPSGRMGGDTSFKFTPAKSGRFKLILQDQLSKAPANSLFRIKLGKFDSATQVFPVAKTHRSPGLIGAATNPDFQTQGGGWFPIRVPKNSLFSGWRPSVTVNTGLELDENKLPDQPMTFPLAINGVIGKPGERDSYDIPLKPKQKFLTVKVFASRLRSPLDAVLVVKDKNNKQLNRTDDSPGSIDPVANVKLPPNAKTVTLEVSDLLGKGGENYCYRLVVGDEQSPPFQLLSARDHLAVPSNGKMAFRITAVRDRYQGPIHLYADLNAPLSAKPITIPAGKNSAFLTIECNGEFSPQLINIYGTSADKKYVAKVLSSANVGPIRQQPLWMNSLVTLGAATPVDFSLRVGPVVKVGFFEGIYMAKVTLVRNRKFENKVRLGYQTDQTVKTVKQKNQTVPDPQSTVRLLGKTIELDFEKGQTEKAVFLVAPAKAPNTNLILTGQKLKLKKDPKNPLVASTIVQSDIVQLPPRIEPKTAKNK